ncbi:MAG TPA: response regulator transcription factor [Buttiauxella sp.]|jgi:two-component system capsular synthesis response regulator RcsB
MLKKIIIADDHPVFLLGLRVLIEQIFNNQYSICGEASNVDELFTLLHAERPDVILTDLSMPGEKNDGLELVKTLHRRYPALPVVVITTMANPSLVQALHAYGAYSVIHKASLTQELTRCLQVLYDGGSTPHQEEEGSTSPLSPREIEVLRLYSTGHTINNIAKMLNRTKQTISAQKRNAMAKLDISSHAELYEYLREMGFQCGNPAQHH